MLRDRGVLERTIRHELVHLMADAALGKRPAWVREGAAIYFAGEPMIPGEPPQRPAFKPEPRASCPSDNELLHPVSVGALSNAYARARALLREADSGGQDVAGRAMNAKLARPRSRLLACSASSAFHARYFGSGTFGTV